METLSYQNFRQGAWLAACTGFLLIILSYWMGKIHLFLLLNGNLGIVADYFFEYATYLGDGAIWVPVALLVIAKRKHYLVLLLCSILYSTLFAQLTKNFLFVAEPRPIKLIADLSQVHVVQGVELHSYYSFPSGHTTTASTIFLMACLLIPSRWIIPAGFMYMLIVGYSRIYLAQHFPLDVGAGMIAGLLSVYFALRLQHWRNQYRKNS